MATEELTVLGNDGTDIQDISTQSVSQLLKLAHRIKQLHPQGLENTTALLDYIGVYRGDNKALRFWASSTRWMTPVGLSSTTT